jgi:nitrate/TMAO reductase-like tetraheme cytochrome c subunit
MIQLSRLYRSTSLRVGLLVVSSLVLMGQGCPSPTPSPPPPPPPGQYVGAAVTADESQGCQRCHSTHYNEWTQTNHAKAFQTLVAAGQDTNPACLPCHVVGYGQPGGFVDAATTPDLEGVQCEDCHGPARQHVDNVDQVALRPPTSIAATVCGNCHNDVHHPTFDEWSSSLHATVTAVPAADFAAGTLLSTCGVCHSGDYRKLAFIEGETSIPADLLKGVPVDQMNAVTCAICHDPHQVTGNNAPTAPAGEDFQLRYPQIKSVVASNTIADNSNAALFNICGQCHHSRGVVWTATTRGPHNSVQSNVYVGEMPIPAGTNPLVPNTNTVHRFVPEQCSTCHMYNNESEGTEATLVSSGHSFQVNLAACVAVGCHPSQDEVTADKTNLQTFVQNGLNSVAARLGDPATWQYSAEGGPPEGPTGQGAIPDAIKQVRFEYDYVSNDGSLGVHNPEYVRLILADMDARLTSIGK